MKDTSSLKILVSAIDLSACQIELLDVSEAYLEPIKVSTMKFFHETS